MMNDKNDSEVEIDIETENPDQMDVSLEEIENNSEEKIKKLQAKIKHLESEKATLMEDFQRAKAEFLNARRRLEDQKIEDIEKATTRFIESILPMADSFHMAMTNEEQWQSVDDVWRKGVESINNQLKSVFTLYGVIEINPTGQTFDPQKHEAVSNLPVSEETENDKIQNVVQLGYERVRKDNRSELIRPAKVTVGQYITN
ncbi:nucleotide exchange factor GrpE [Candidatus Kaiserbacteria bacterium]|nr:nucleotide exchange factor GrpE [Candidatus Kaiserbacteria bacterium]